MKITLTDAGILELYRLWSEVGFIEASPQMVEDFRTWLICFCDSGAGPALYDYEQVMLDEFHKQEMEEAPLDN